ncbi:hypothetical protein O6H91_18G080600 [Diphasiastrum complanatum]|uniref:Uncharacterized protein n=1 Tax=Diphasiastrum complanatum TaxID=34168 RepID=A0ACC2B341_DIPCM|nr:hypothetical protein O6H91_18G080600 [Diphasiastrum complanatum]
MAKKLGGNGAARLGFLHQLEGHTDRVWGVAWNPASRSGGAPSMLASCSGDKTVRIWEQQSTVSSSSPSWTCQAVLDESHSRTVRACDWSPNGKLLATGSFDATTSIWEHVGGEFDCIATLEVKIHGHENEVKSVAWNTSGTLLATCSRDKTVWIWELQPGNDFECVSVLNGHTQDVKMVLWHPSRDVLVSASYDNTIKVWAEDRDGDDWRCVQTLAEPGWGHTSTVWQLSFNMSGDQMVSCSDDLQLMVWDSTVDPSEWTGNGGGPWKHLCTISGHHERTIFSVHWSRTNGLIATGSADDCIRIFAEDPTNVASSVSFCKVLEKQKAHEGDVNSVRWHPKDPRLLASAGDDGVIKIWEFEQDL